MQDDPNQPKTIKDVSDGFFTSLLKGLAKEFARLIIAFAVGTIAAGAACLYYNIPLVFSLVGGFVVMGVWLALSSDSLFD
ncbi:MAG: hypothetical protein AAAFM81_06225 [Pseudomonadota bacterium]